MALQKTITYCVRLVGPTAFNAYIKIDSVSGSKDCVMAQVNYLKETSSGELIQTITYEFQPDLNGPNFIEQAYKHLKTLPEFSGSIDC